MSSPALVRCLKRTQLAVAIATTLAFGVGLVYPGVMGLFVVPVTLIYVIWAVRAALNHRLSIWLSLASTIMVAVFLGALGASFALSTFRSLDERAIPLVAIDPATGNVIELPPEFLPQLQQGQAHADRRNRIHASILLLIGLGAWLVIGLHAKEWRWALTGQTIQKSRSST